MLRHCMNPGTASEVTNGPDLTLVLGLVNEHMIVAYDGMK